ncbi:hypothetical protein AFULGI_00016200 [Archaeoglobus fulgidus DSM 8774]|uniref:DUF2283 domain-containing protein n=1 Tax=Archaeoglobus fulgidus DSM 8774 TaxID=1344584 RepID=A0A075WF12_ARCFL|nr:DUF2283 domain-containing protein [Archaeoglobus fulgidus]AIG98382.1 hypothetical protein AFULGI_00016200 [Archaeoglobus fulgidus DSM 8774]
MKISYDRDADILMIEISDEDMDYAEEAGPMIIHFSKNGKPVLIEILDASEFLAEITKISMKTKSKELVEVQICEN